MLQLALEPGHDHEVRGGCPPWPALVGGRMRRLYY
jgi:hypothetical protein